jgi:hypothetical protein
MTIVKASRSPPVRLARAASAVKHPASSQRS